MWCDVDKTIKRNFGLTDTRMGTRCVGWQPSSTPLLVFLLCTFPCLEGLTITVPHNVWRPRHVLVDVGSKRGASVQSFLRGKWDGAVYSVHAFEPNPDHVPALQRAARRWGLGDRLTVHPAAAWIADGKVQMSTACDVPAGGASASAPRRPLWRALSLWGGGAGGVGGCMFLPPSDAGREVTVDAVDFSSWLLRTYVWVEVLYVC